MNFRAIAGFLLLVFAGFSLGWNYYGTHHGSPKNQKLHYRQEPAPTEKPKIIRI